MDLFIRLWGEVAIYLSIHPAIIILVSAARIVFVVTYVEALLFLKLHWLMQLPILDFSTMKKYLFEILFKARVEWHDSDWVNLHVSDVTATRMLPRRLPG